jgi:hypothetical protein
MQCSEEWTLISVVVWNGMGGDEMFAALASLVIPSFVNLLANISRDAGG